MAYPSNSTLEDHSRYSGPERPDIHPPAHAPTSTRKTSPSRLSSDRRCTPKGIGMQFDKASLHDLGRAEDRPDVISDVKLLCATFPTRRRHVGAKEVHPSPPLGSASPEPGRASPPHP